MAKKKTPEKYKVWIDVRKRFHLSDAQIQMARELGMNPKGFGKLANHKQEPWKAPLPEFIGSLYIKRFGKKQPDQVRSIEQLIAAQDVKNAACCVTRALQRDQIETDLARIKALSEKRDRENFEFRAFLKSECLPERLDALVHQLYREVSAVIDCTTCANCCREIMPILNQDDVERFAQGLEVSSKELATEYLMRGDDGGFTFRHAPCPFLRDKSCRNYGARPNDCRSYPHLHKQNIMGRLMGVVANYSICPIVFNVYEGLKKELRSGRSYRKMPSLSRFMA
jgi:Fe-S-cluster containining protein